MKITKLNYNVGQLLEAYHTGTITAWFKKSTISDGQVRVARETGLIWLLKHGFHVRGLNAVFIPYTDKDMYDVVDGDNLLLNLVALEYSGAFDEMSDEDRKTALAVPVTVTLYAELSDNERFALTHYNWL